MFTAKQQTMLKKAFLKPRRFRDLPVAGERIMKRTRYKMIQNFLRAIQEEKIIEPYVFSAENGKRITLYSSSSLKDMPPCCLAESLFPAGYFCNTTSVYYHNLTNQVPSTIYICFETIPRRHNATHETLTENAIRQSFLKANRHTKYIFKFRSSDIVVVDRRVGSRFGVDPVRKNSDLLPKGASVSCLERALIDAVVSPQYNGGIPNVYSYFKKAGRRIDIDRLIDIYRRLEFIYPYSQTVGFFMERLGMTSMAKRIRRTFPPQHAFYVDHHAKSSWIQDKTWRIYYPKGLVDEN